MPEDEKKKRKLRDVLKDRLPSQGEPGAGGSLFRSVFLWFAIAAAIVLILQFYLKAQKPTVKLDTSEFIEQVNLSNIVSIAFTEGSIQIEGEMRIDPDDPSVKAEWVEQLNITEPRTVQFRGTILDGDISRNGLSKRLEAAGVAYETKPAGDYWKLLVSSLLPVLIIVLVIGFLMHRQMKRGMGMAMSFGRSRARRTSKEKDHTTFQDLAGCDEAKEEVGEIVDYLRDPKKFQRLGGKIPRGVMLMGQPGTGKTLLAKAIAGEADVPFFSISGSDFVEMFVGVGASRVRDLFEQGKRSAPCIIFVDEIDAVGRLRGAGLGGGHDEREQTLNALLVEMDGFNPNDGVIIIAATNRPDVLDPALLRPGRFDRQVVIDMPDQRGREAILKIHVREVRLNDDVDLSRIARGTPGFSGADLANLINEAALAAARHECDSVSHEYFEEARDKVRFGRERRSHVMDEQDRRYTAYHEAGHALVTAMIPECEPLHKVTIMPRGVAFLGATMQLPEKDKYHYTSKELTGQIASFMGGRVAEELIFNDLTSGAKSDIKNATDIARKMVCEWGMSDLMGPLAYGEREEHIFLGREIDRHIDYSDEIARNIDKEIRRILDEAVARARKIITENRDKLEAIAQALLEFEVIEGDEVNALIRGEKIKKKSAKARKLKNKNDELIPETAPPADGADGDKGETPDTRTI